MASIPPDPAVFTSSWRSNDPLFNFQHHVAPHIPRAWERAPHKPFAPQHRGRKVWKRYNLRSKEPEHATQTSRDRGDSVLQDDEFADTDRPIKRQCLNSAPENAGEQQDLKPPKYIATLRARASGTPRRKLAKRKSLKSDRRKSVVGQVSEGTDIPFEIARALKDSEQDTDELPVSEPDSERSDMVEPYAGGDGDADETVPEETSPLEESHDPAALHELVSVEANEVGSIKDLEDPVGDETTSNGQDDGTPTTPAELHSTAAISPEKPPMIDDGLKDIATVSAPDNSSHGNQSFLGSNVRQGADVEEKTVLGMADIHRVKEAQGSENTEQTTNLESPHVPPAPVINSSGDESSNEIPDCEPEILEPQVSESSRSDSSTDVERADQSPAVEILEPPPSESPSTRHQTRASPIKRQILEPQQPETDGSITVTDSNPSSGDTIQATNDSAPPAEQPSIPKGRTRSGMRFSDDTTLLKDFLNRARAHKAAKAIPNPSDPTQPLISPLPSPRSVSRRSPRRSPRKALLELDSNSPSPTKSRDVALRPGTPPGKVNRLVGFEEVDAGEEAMTEPMSCRRSARTRLPTPAANKNQIGAPSFIPVIRRGMEGVEQVVLKKSEAQELAMVTRANTRRNKGGAKFPALTLQTLAAETSPGPKGDGKKRAGAKNVNWDGQLLYFQGAYATAGGTGGSKEKDGREQEKEKEKEQGDEREKRPKIRRLKPLGLPVNGTPAPKKTLESESARPAAKGTPAPKKKSRPRPGMGGGDASGPVGAKANNGTPAPAPRRNGKPRP